MQVGIQRCKLITLDSELRRNDSIESMLKEETHE